MRNSINILASKGIIIGVTEDLFAPSKTITKAEAAAFIVRLLDYYGKIESPKKLTGGDLGYFKDVRNSDWFYKEVYAAVKNNIVDGTGGSFYPNGRISRLTIFEIAAEMLKKHAGINLESDENGLDYLLLFTDKYEFLFAIPREKFTNSMGLVIKEELVLWRIDGRLALEETMTRGDFAVMLYRLFNKMS
jgi:hypothetical protein